MATRTKRKNDTPLLIGTKKHRTTCSEPSTLERQPNISPFYNGKTTNCKTLKTLHSCASTYTSTTHWIPGKPNQFMIDRQYTPVIYFWNVPDTSTYSMVYWAMNQQEDVTASNQDTDIPYRWSDTLCAGLSAKLAMKYAPDKFQILNEMYERSFGFAASSDNDGVSLKIQPTALNLT